MQRLTKNFPLFDLEPGLVSEWHPSSNGKLTPRNVTLAYPKKVWWICKQGHEWRATIKSRRKKLGCPSCEKEPISYLLAGLKNVSLQKTRKVTGQGFSENVIHPVLDDTFGAEMEKNFRKSRRYKIKTMAMLETPDSGHLFYIQIRNYSHGGLYLETEAAFTKGTRTRLRLDKPLFSDGIMEYKSTIRWCSKLDDDILPAVFYGVGMEFY